MRTRTRRRAARWLGLASVTGIALVALIVVPSRRSGDEDVPSGASADVAGELAGSTAMPAATEGPTSAPSAPPTPTATPLPAVPAPTPTPTPTPSWVAPELLFGVTHSQVSADPWYPASFTEEPKLLLSELAQIQNQHLMGWGAVNPEPRPDSYEWTSLDGRVALMEGGGGTAAMTLCCAPDWMKGGEAGTTDWTQLDSAPLPEHYGDYAELAAEAAVRYPQVSHFLVWNELKGFYLESEQRWDYAAYTALYNEVYAAVKEVRPDALVGGPYIGMDSWGPRRDASHPSEVSGPWGVLDQRPLDVIEYWLENAVGADFVVVDGHLTGFDGDVADDPQTALAKFGAANRWLEARTDIPIWWAEIYVDHPEVTRPKAEAALLVDLLDELDESGAEAALLWDPNGTYEADCGDCLWADLRGADPTSPRPLPDLLRAWRTPPE